MNRIMDALLEYMGCAYIEKDGNAKIVKKVCGHCIEYLKCQKRIGSGINVCDEWKG